MNDEARDKEKLVFFGDVTTGHTERDWLISRTAQLACRLDAAWPT